MVDPDQLELAILNLCNQRPRRDARERHPHLSTRNEACTDASPSWAAGITL